MDEDNSKPGDLRRQNQELAGRATFWGRIFNLPIFRVLVILKNAVYNFCFPLSERRSSYYGYGSPQLVRENRIKWLWRKLHRAYRHSFLASSVHTLENRWLNWWYPLTDEGEGYGGRFRRNRIAHIWRRLHHRVRRSFIGRAWDRVSMKWYAWWYPVVEDPHGYAAYAQHRRNRLIVTWWRIVVAFRATWLGKKCQMLADQLYNWCFPVVKMGGYSYAYGATHLVRINRLSWLVLQTCHVVRMSWLGRKFGWVLDEIGNAATAIHTHVVEDLSWTNMRPRLFRWQTAVLLALIVSVVTGWFIYGLPRYNRFIEETYARQARMFANKGDARRAALRARQVLQRNRDNPNAIRVMADLADYFDPRNAIHWRQRLVALQPDATNRLALAKTALQAEAFPFSTASKALNEIAPVERENSAYHLVAGTLAVKLSDLKAAEQHYAEAVRLNPDDPVNRMSLAVVRLQSSDPKFISDSRTTLELLRADKQLGLLATRSLIAESIARRDLTAAESLSEQVLTNAQASFSDSIMHLAILNAAKSGRFNDFLKRTQRQAEQHPFYIGELASWMNTYGFAHAGVEWLEGLPAELKQAGLVPLAQADAYAKLGRWTDMMEFLEKERWQGMDPVRLALMAFALWKDSGGKPGGAMWRQTVELGSRSPLLLKTLAEMAANWGWKEQTEDVLWEAERRYPAANWPLASLQRYYTAQKDTSGLWQTFRAIHKKNPDDPLMRNNCAMMSLLLNRELAEAGKEASALYVLDPKNPVFVSTFAFSLYVQGQPQEAVRVLRELGLNTLDDPSLATYYGIFLVAAGDRQTAQTYLAKSSKAFLLPEEIALVEKAKKAL